MTFGAGRLGVPRVCLGIAEWGELCVVGRRMDLRGRRMCWIGQNRRLVIAATRDARCSNPFAYPQKAQSSFRTAVRYVRPCRATG